MQCRWILFCYHTDQVWSVWGWLNAILVLYDSSASQIIDLCHLACACKNLLIYSINWRGIYDEHCFQWLSFTCGPCLRLRLIIWKSSRISGVAAKYSIVVSFERQTIYTTHLTRRVVVRSRDYLYNTLTLSNSLSQAKLI